MDNSPNNSIFMQPLDRSETKNVTIIIFFFWLGRYKSLLSYQFVKEFKIPDLTPLKGHNYGESSIVIYVTAHDFPY